MGMENALLKMYRNKRRARSKLREVRAMHQDALDTIEVMDTRYSELYRRFSNLKREKEAVAYALNEARREGEALERRDSDETNKSVPTQSNIVSNLVSNLVFSVIIYMYIYVVCHAVLSSDHHIWLITNNLVFIQVLYMMVSMYTTVKTAS